MSGVQWIVIDGKMVRHDENLPAYLAEALKVAGDARARAYKNLIRAERDLTIANLRCEEISRVIRKEKASD